MTSLKNMLCHTPRLTLAAVAVALLGGHAAWAAYEPNDVGTPKDRASRPWVQKLRPYVDPDLGGNMLLASGLTLDKQKIQDEAGLLKAATDFWPEYRQKDFPLGKTAQLLDIEHNLQQALRQTPRELRRSRALVYGDIGDVFDEIIDELSAESGDRGEPNVVTPHDLAVLRQAVQSFAQAPGHNETLLIQLRDKLDRIESLNQHNRAIRAEHTYMMPTRYEGPDADVLRRQVEQTVKRDTDATEILRVTLPAKTWERKNLWEWTDLSHSDLRYEVTRTMIAEAAARDKDGEVMLHRVYLSQVRQPDGRWGPIQSHIQWSKPIAAENVDQQPPST